MNLDGAVFFLSPFRPNLSHFGGLANVNTNNDESYKFTKRVGGRTSGREIYGRKEFYERLKEVLAVKVL